MKIRKCSSFKWILREDGGFIYNYETGSVKVINATGSFILKKCEALSISQIVSEMQSIFDIPNVSEVEKDVKNFLDRLIKEGFVCQET